MPSVIADSMAMLASHIGAMVAVEVDGSRTPELMVVPVDLEELVLYRPDRRTYRPAGEWRAQDGRVYMLWCRV